MVEDEEHFCVGCQGLKEARGPLLKLMEEAQSGFGMLQDEEEFVGIMQHVNANSGVGNFLYLLYSPITIDEKVEQCHNVLYHNCMGCGSPNWKFLFDPNSSTILQELYDKP